VKHIVTIKRVPGGGREWLYATKHRDVHPAAWIDSKWAQFGIIAAVFALLCIRW
jgi:hypothetical protein